MADRSLELFVTTPNTVERRFPIGSRFAANEGRDSHGRYPGYRTRDSGSRNREHFRYRSRSGIGLFKVRASSGTGGVPSTIRTHIVHPSLSGALRTCPHSPGGTKPWGSRRSTVGSWVALFSRELLGLLADNPGIFARYFRYLVRGGQKPDRRAPPAGNHLAGHGRGAVDCRYGRLRFLYAPANAGRGATVLGADQRPGRTVPLGVPARSPEPRRTHDHRKRWRSVILHERCHHQYRGRHQHRSPCGCFLDHVISRKIPSG